MKVKTLVTQSCLTLLDPRTVACQAPLSMEFCRQEYWSGWPFPTPWDLSNPGTEPRSPALQADSLLSEPPGKLFCLITCTLKVEREVRYIQGEKKEERQIVSWVL